MAQNHLDVVQAVKADLEARRVPLSGSCGAFRILYGVAIRLNASDPAKPWGFLLKTGGNRAVPQPDGSCLSGDETTAPGYATDYLIDKRTMYGYDVLGDGGGANTPQWPDDPETAPDMVARNTAYFRAPEPWTGWGNAPPGEEPPGDPTDDPPVVPSDADIIAAIEEMTGVLLKVLAALHVAESMQVLRQDDLTSKIDDLERRIFGTKAAPGLILTGKFLGFDATLSVPRPK